MDRLSVFRCWALASVSVVLVVTASTAAAQSPDSRAAARREGLRVDSTRIDSVFAKFDSSHSPGCALGIIRGGRTIYARGYGMADLENGTPISPRTVFDIGSTSKQFTAASIALLAADGRLLLDDDVRKYIPELPKYGKPITLRHLLQHTSGLRDYIGIMYLAGFRFADMTTDAEALEAITRQKALNFPPGSEHYYSNSGYFLASIVVERASGMSLAAFARKRIFEPLRMTSTLVRSRHALLIPGRAIGYSPGDSSGFSIDMSDWEQTGDGAVHTTVEDLALWDQNFYTPTVGGQQLLERLLAPGHLDNGKALTYALGLFVDEYRGLRRVHHGGSWAGYRAELLRFPDQRASVAVLCNLATASASGLAGRVADILLAEHLKPESKPEQRAQAAETGAAPPATRDAASAGAELARYTGLYFHEASSAFRRIAIDSGRLVLNISGSVLPLRALGGDRFQSTEHPITIAFEASKPGAPLKLKETIEGDPAVTYEPMPPAVIGARALAAYAGTYDSKELATAWTLAVRDSVLVLQHRSLGDTRLEPAFADAFTAGPTLIRFTREKGGGGGKGGRIAAFSVSMGRARNIGFTRRGKGYETAQRSTLITNVMLIDGTGSAARRASVRLAGDRIAAVGDLRPAEGDDIFDARGLTLAPGFIDTHSHADAHLADHRDALAHVSQGVTTAVVGQDGGSVDTLATFFAGLERAPGALNIASYVGHNTVRYQVLGEDYKREATTAEIERMKVLVADGMKGGALGFSTGLEYDPGIYSTRAEVIELATVAARFGGRYISHMRSEDRAFWAAVEELLEVGRKANLPVQISHAKLAMRDLSGQADSLIGLLVGARRSGVEVTLDIYPYPYWQSSLTVLFPERNFGDNPGALAAARFALDQLAPADGLLLSRYAPNPAYVGKTIADIARERGADPADTYLALIREAEALRADSVRRRSLAPDGVVEMVIGTSMDERDIERLLRWPYANIAIDGALVDRHPRGSGAFPRVLARYVRERLVLTLPDAIRKMTSLAARHVGIRDRGTIAPGQYADLVLFDPIRVLDRATPGEPTLLSTGIARVWVNGEVVYEDGRPTQLYPGRVIRRMPNSAP